VTKEGRELLEDVEEALGLLFHDHEPGTLSLQRLAWIRVRAALGLAELPIPNEADRKALAYQRRMEAALDRAPDEA
jgi:hypothetical protein